MNDPRSHLAAPLAGGWVEVAPEVQVEGPGCVTVPPMTPRVIACPVSVTCWAATGRQSAMKLQSEQGQYA